jgi:hypothetical protein
VVARTRGTDPSRAHIGMDLYGPAPDFAGLARSMGWWAEGPIENADDLQPALQRAVAQVKTGKPALLDAVTQHRWDRADAAVRLIKRFRLDRDLHVLTKGSRQSHQPLAGEIGKPAIEERRNLRMIDARQRRCSSLGQALALDNLPDVASCALISSSSGSGNPISAKTLPLKSTLLLPTQRTGLGPVWLGDFAMRQYIPVQA